jgi:DNA polymerase II small subunit
MSYNREVHFIGMITDVNTTKKGNTLVDLEDETGEVKIFINKDEPQLKLKLLNDEVIGVSGETNPKLGMVMTKRIIRPMPPRSRIVNRADDDVEAVFISDIHVGSTEFLENDWNYFVKWLNGSVELPGNVTSEKVRYLVVAGDLVDGIGVYPGQQEELVIPDIFEQYRTLANYISEIRDDIKIILAPGNHDAVRPAEPQPALGEEYQKFFRSGTMFIGNPSYLSLHGVEILVYHGRSFDDIVKYIPAATYTNPISPMKEMMMRRHLVPIWGERTPIAPEHFDSLLIDRLPDVFVTGHVHTAGCERVNDMLFINASSWQDQTSFQKTLNFNPDPCKAFLVNLHSVRGTELNFKLPNF